MSEIQNVIVCFAGRKGSGKSTALRGALERCPRFFLWDLNGEHGWIPNRFGRMAAVEQFLAWGDTQQHFAGSYLPSRDIPAHFERLCSLVYLHGRMAFAVEEAPEICSAGSLSDAFGMVVRRGRHRRLNLAWTCQRLAETSITLRSQTDYFVIGSQAEPRDLDALAERCGREAAEKAASLGLHGFLTWDVVNRQEVPLETIRAALAGVPGGSRVLAGAGKPGDAGLGASHALSFKLRYDRNCDRALLSQRRKPNELQAFAVRGQNAQEVMTKVKTQRKRSRFDVYNSRKRQALELFEQRGWLNPAAWAVLAGFYPIRASYSYLGRLHKWGLLTRRLDAQGLILYRLSERGRARLAWLRRRAR